MTKNHFIIGSRGSQLALWQANWVKAHLEHPPRRATVEIQIIKTTGDKITDVPLAKVGTKGLFTKEIEEALLAGTIDLAVHSLKDLPTDLPAGLALGAISEREDPRDAFLSAGGRKFAELAPGARIGTSSLRRQAQLQALRRDVAILPLRGNLDTRLRKLDEGQYDAVVLAAAGLKRLGQSQRVVEFFSPEVMCPAIGQGALGIEIRAGDEQTAAAIRFLDHAESRAATTAERALLKRLGGGCQVPIAAYGEVRSGRLKLVGVVVSLDGGEVARDTIEGEVSQSAELGVRLAETLLERGARKILEAVHADIKAITQPPGAG